MLDYYYLRPDVYFLPVLAILALLVTVLIAATLLNRYAYDQRRARRERERLRMEDMFRRLEDVEDQKEAKRALGKLLNRASGPNKIVFVELVNGMPEPKRSLYLDYVMYQGGGKSLTSQALHGRRKWKRIEAIEVLGRLEHPEVSETLAQCLEDDDEDVRYATIRALTARRELRASDILLNLFGTDRIDHKSLVARLQDFPIPMEGLLWPRLANPDPEIRMWIATLLEVSKEKETVKHLMQTARDDNADVRSAAIRSLANIGDPEAKEILPNAFADPEWFVRAAAANAAGRLKATELSSRVISLLRDRVWWVRQSAKTALIEMCPEVEKELVEHLAADDHFVRNIVVEILELSGTVDRKATELEKYPDSEEARRFFRLLATAGGRGTMVGLAERATPQVREVLYEILDDARNIPS